MSQFTNDASHLRRWVRRAFPFVVAFSTNLAAQGTVVPQGRTAAQDAAEARVGHQVSNTQIADAIRRSGLTAEQVRERLRSAGYDPSLADPFFDVRQSASASNSASARGGGGADGAAFGDGNSTFASALEQIGLLKEVTTSGSSNGEVKSAAEEATRSDASPRIGTANASAGSSSSSAVFGLDVFSSASSAFDPVVAGPVDPSYRLGFGDQMQFILTGDVETAYQIEVRRDGTVLVPQLGQVAVAGLTLEGARAALRRRAGQVYSGIGNGTTRLDVAVSRIRSNALFVIGEVRRPGAYVVSALSTVFYALARAEGPTARGSFRAIQVRRAGQVVKTLDLYDYLLHGSAEGDIRTEQGDVIYVPLATRTVNVVGAVRRPATFELLPGEGFRELLGFAGGMVPTAAMDRVQIDRVLPPELRSPGKERVLIDVKMHGDPNSLAAVPLSDGDVVTVFTVGDLRRNAVEVKGQVLRPGTYEIGPGLTLWDLIRNAQGLLPWALTDRVKVVRPILETGKSELFSLDLADAQSRNFKLAEFDEVTVLDARVANPAEMIQVTGAVFQPRVLLHSEGQTLRDVIDLAGGFRPEAMVIEVSRRRERREYSDTTSIVLSFPLDSARQIPVAAGSFAMRRDDRVFVRAAPGFRPQRFVEVAGMFARPGVYPLVDEEERVSDIVARSGGLLPSAYPGSFRLIRGGRPVAIDLERALKHDPQHDLPLLGGDQLRIYPNPGTVFVTGAVERSVLLRYVPGRSLEDYVRLAGGAKRDGDVKRANVEAASGGIDRVERRWLLFRHWPEITSGATITVPQKPESTTSVGSVLATTLQYATALSSLAVAYAVIRRY